MKTLLGFVALIVLCGSSLAQNLSQATEFRGSITQVLGKAGAVAFGNFFWHVPVKPGAELAPGLPDKGLRSREFPEIYVTGLPSGIYDGVAWSGYLVEDGVKTFTTVLGAPKTLPAFRVVAAPPAKTTPKAGGWMWQAKPL